MFFLKRGGGLKGRVARRYPFFSCETRMDADF